MRKKVRIVIGSLIILMAVFVLFFAKKLFNDDGSLETLQEAETQIEEKKYREFEDFNELAYWVAVKNGDWSDLKLTDVFREKYNEKDGIFGDMQFDKVEYKPSFGGKYPFEDSNYLVVTQGLKKTAYIFMMDPDSGDGYNDVIIRNVYELTDENGNELDFREPTTEKNFLYNMTDLAWGHEEEQAVGVTYNFHKKYPFFLDIFEHYSPLIYNPIEIVHDRCSWERKEAYFIVDSKLECKKRHYKVKIILDNIGYIDDVEVNKVNEIEYDVEPLGWDWYKDHISPIIVLIYPNSNYKLIKSTENFKKKYNNENRLFNFASVKDYQRYDKLICIELDDSIKYYYMDVLLLDDEERTVDDIIIRELPYGNISFEEAKELYLKEFGENVNEEKNR